MNTQKNNSKTNKNGSIRCFPTTPKDGGTPNYLTKVISEDHKFARVFWLGRDGKLLKPSNEKTWSDWPKSCKPNPIEQDLPENLVKFAIKIFGQIGAAIQAGQTVSAFIEKEEAEKIKAVVAVKKVSISPEEQKRIDRNLELFANIAKKKAIREAAEIKKQNLIGLQDLQKKAFTKKTGHKKVNPVKMKVENRGGKAPVTVVKFENSKVEKTTTDQPKKKVDYRGPEKLGYTLSPETFGALKQFQRTLPK